MADTKQLKLKIAATKNIKKITNALEIISTLKLQKVKKKADHLREYVATMLEIVDLMLQKGIVLYDKGDFLSERELLIVVSSEKGLCGSLNSQLFKFLHQQYAAKKNITDLYVIGKKAHEFFSRQGYTIMGYTQVSDAVNDSELASVFTYMNEQEEEKTYGSIRIAYNYFKNTMKQIPLIFPIKPFTPEIVDEFLETVGMVRKQKRSRIHDFVLEPDANTVHDTLKHMIIDYSLYTAILHNKTGEFAARMLAMKGAKDNASVIIDDVTLRYNKARQDAITQEVSEIVSAKSVIEG